MSFDKVDELIEYTQWERVGPQEYHWVYDPTDWAPPKGWSGHGLSIRATCAGTEGVHLSPNGDGWAVEVYPRSNFFLFNNRKEILRWEPETEEGTGRLIVALMLLHSLSVQT